ncbi:MAG: hypothetical protein WCE48_07910 [Steroidobacteraceae bacterium]
MSVPPVEPRLLKRDLFGTVSVSAPTGRSAVPIVLRDARAARWWTRGLAFHLARRERRALERLAGIEGIPRLLDFGAGIVRRSWIDGEPMQCAAPRDPAYYVEALRLLRRMHARNVTHNDLAKEPNWLVTPQQRPALVDFQLARCVTRRGPLFRALAHDDLRHLLKHKRTYLPQRLTAREQRVLASPSCVTRAWRGSGQRIYRLITRRFLGWADREGAGDRHSRR